MSAAITLEELLAWNDEAARYWKSHLEMCIRDSLQTPVESRSLRNLSC